MLSFCLHIKVLLSVLVLVWMTLNTERTILSQEPNGFRQLIRSHNRSSSFRSQIPTCQNLPFCNDQRWNKLDSSLKFPLTRLFKVDMCAICVDYCWSLRDLEDCVIFYLPGGQWSLIDEKSCFYSEKNFGFFYSFQRCKPLSVLLLLWMNAKMISLCNRVIVFAEKKTKNILFTFEKKCEQQSILWPIHFRLSSSIIYPGFERHGDFFSSAHLLLWSVQLCV